MTTRTKTISTIPWIFGNLLAGSMDFCVGMLIATATILWFGATPTWGYACIGGVLGLLPDFDIVFSILWRALTGTPMSGNHHEKVTHWPIPMIILGTVVAFVFGGNSFMWGIIAFVCITGHYMHDAAMMQGSDKWRWFFRTEPGFWSAQGRKDPAHVEHEKWIRDNWLWPPSPLSVGEYAIGGMALWAVAQALLQ